MRTVLFLVGIMLAEAIRGKDFADEDVAKFMFVCVAIFFVMDVVELVV